MAKISETMFRKYVDGQDRITAQEYMREREVLRLALNDAENKYEIVNDIQREFTDINSEINQNRQATEGAVTVVTQKAEEIEVRVQDVIASVHATKEQAQVDIVTASTQAINEIEESKNEFTPTLEEVRILTNEAREYTDDVLAGIGPYNGIAKDKNAMPSLEIVQFGVTKDTKEVFVGNGEENMKLLDGKDKEEINIALSDIAINIKSFSSFVVNGDWTEAIRQACAHIKMLGSGKLFFPKDNYEIFSASLYPVIYQQVLYDFGAISDVEFDFNGSTLTVNRTETVERYWRYFVFTGSKNIKLHNLNHDSPNAKINGGAYILTFYGENENIEIRNVYGQGIDRLIYVNGYNGVSYAEGRVKNIVIDNVKLKGCYKPVTLTNGVKGIKVTNYSLDGGHRAVHLYGCEDVNLDIESNNCDANNVLFTSYYDDLSLGVRNAKIKIKSKGEGLNAMSLLAFHYNGNNGRSGRGGIFENIEAELIVDDSPGYDYVTMMRNYISDSPITPDTQARGHIWKDITLKGNVRGGERCFIDFPGLFEGDHIENFKIKDLVDYGGNTSTIKCTGLVKGSVTLENVVSSANFRLALVPPTKECFVIDSELYQGVSDSSKVTFINSTIKGDTTDMTNTKLINSKLENQYYAHSNIPIKNADKGMWWSNYPHIISRQESLSLANVSTTTLSFVIDPSILTGRIYQPGIFRFQLAYQNSGATIRGCVRGELILRKNSASSTSLDTAILINQQPFIELGTDTATVAVVVSNGILNMKLTTSSGTIDRVGGIIYV